MMNRLLFSIVAVAVATLTATPAQAQKPKGQVEDVSTHHALGVAKEVLVRQGFDVVRVEVVGDDQVVYYRRGNMGNGKGKGPVERLVIRRVETHVVFVDTPDTILSAIIARLKLP